MPRLRRYFIETSGPRLIKRTLRRWSTSRPPLCMDSHPERMVGVDTVAVGIASGTTTVGKGAANIIVMEMTTDNWRPLRRLFSVYSDAQKVREPRLP
jgi:hypothetical protein